MAIVAYKKEVSPGVYETVYMVTVDTRNKYTGKRVQRKRSNISSIPKAERVYRELWSEVREERPDGVNFKEWGPLLDSYIHFIESNVRSAQNPLGFSPHLAVCKRSHLRRTEAWSNLHIDLLTPQFVTLQLDEMERSGVSRILTNHLLKEVKCVFAYALNLGMIKANPFSGMKMRKTQKRRREALNHNELQLLLSEAQKRNHKYYYIWLLTVCLGLRRSELAGLKWTDIDFEQGLINLQRQLIPNEGLVEKLKDGEDRVVSIPTHLLPTLKEMKLRTTSEFVIEVKCSDWKDGHQSKVIRKFCRDIGIKEVTHHQLRATHITLALIDGVPLGIVKENVGHSKLSTTDSYFRSAGIQMRGQMDALKINIPQDCVAEVIPLKTAK